jgi:hypothetical protein
MTTRIHNRCSKRRGFLSLTIILRKASLRTRLFSVFFFPGSDNLFADDTVFQKIDELNIELYTDKKDPDTETGSKTS